MTRAHDWLSGARPRTLPAALAPVAVGTGAAAGAGGFDLGRALLAVLVSLALQVGVNFANDYSDGVRGTDATRVGPTRLVASGLATPTAVRTAALAALAVAALAGLVLAALTTWWVLLVGVLAMLAAWGYTGGSRPYGYRGLGEISVFVFFGLIAVVGTAYVQVERILPEAVIAAVPVGMVACALLVVNNLRDLDNDAIAGKRTLAVRLGDRGTRRLYAALVIGALVLIAALSPLRPYAYLGLLAAIPAVPPVGAVLAGARGLTLLPALRDTGITQLALGVFLGIGLAF